jgi:hypothetical protein
MVDPLMATELVKEHIPKTYLQEDIDPVSKTAAGGKGI